MKLSLTTLALLSITSKSSAFSPNLPSARVPLCSQTVLKGYLDDLSKELYQESNDPDIENTTKEATNMSKDQVDRYGPGSLADFVDFGDEFDGGDGQMGVAGDGNKKLEKFDDAALFKSKSMSAKNAWGSSSGYADELIKKGVDSQKAQRLENWQNQQEIRKKQLAQKAMIDQYETAQQNADADWRTLSKFGVERNQDFDMNEAFGTVEVGGELVDTVELKAGMGSGAIHEFKVRNEYMGFADFRCAFTDDTNPGDWTVSPTEGSLSKADTDFVVKFRANNPGQSQATLVLETEDFKKTWYFIGSTA